MVLFFFGAFTSRRFCCAFSNQISIHPVRQVLKVYRPGCCCCCCCCCCFILADQFPGFSFLKLHRVQPRTDGPIIDDKSFSRSPSQVGLDSDRLWSPFFSLAKWPPNKIEAQNKKNALALLEHRLYRVFCFVFPGTINIVKVSISIYWVLLGFTGFYWVSLEESSTFCLK